MTSRIVLLDKENHGDFLPCIALDIHSKLSEATVFGFGIVAGKIDEPEAPAGAIICEYEDGVATILSVGVLPHFQRQGLGSRLINYMAGACARQNFMELDARLWTKDGDTNPIELFFTDNDFAVQKGEGVRYAVKISDIAGSSLEKHITSSLEKQSETITAFSSISPLYIKKFLKDFDLPNSIFDEVDLQVSCATVAAGRITSAILMSKLQNEVVNVIYLCSQISDGRSAAAVLFSALKNLYRLAPADTTVVFSPANDVVDQIAERLLKGCEVEELHEKILYLPLISLWGEISNEENFDKA